MKNGKFLDDFNDSIENLIQDADYSKTISEISASRVEVLALMKKLRNPPKKYEEAYAALKTLYSHYSAFTGLVVSPTGSYNSFSENFDTFDKNTIDAYEEVLILLD